MIFENLIHNRKKISINLLSETDIDVYEVEDDIIIVIHVPMAKREQTEETIDMALIEKLVLLELDMETLHSYRNRHRSFKPAHPWLI